jgi:hypothetical protein
VPPDSSALRELAGLLADPDEPDEHLAERIGLFRERLRKACPPAIASAMPAITARKRGFSALSRKSASASRIEIPAPMSCSR